MRRTLCVLLALTLLLVTLSGCAKVDMGWFTDKFKSGDAQTDAAPTESTPQQETTAVTTAARIAKITARIRIVFTLEDKSFFFK